MNTAAQLIEKAARAVRLIPERQSVPDYITERGLEILNDLFDEFGGAEVTIPNQSVLTFNTVANNGSYTIGPSGSYDVNTAQVIGIEDCYLTLNNIRYAILPMDENINSNIMTPTSTGTPSLYLLREFNVYSELFFQPVPFTTFQVTLICKQRLSEVIATSLLSQIPTHWLRAFKLLIGSDFIDYYALPENPRFQAKVDKAMMNLQANNAVDVGIKKMQTINSSRYCYYPFWWF